MGQSRLVPDSDVWFRVRLGSVFSPDRTLGVTKSAGLNHKYPDQRDFNETIQHPKLLGKSR